MAIMTIALIALAVVAIAATIYNLRLDGYHRVRSAPIARQKDQFHWQ